ncbi:response regulator [Gynurincola endophyticus]|jgi:CheY-like chemotaxis protein|uniref:response regulator n=1 Tax=Gynurincola endophyticus TaxID=2479004 RepID=UPI000F8E702E|nr:response regulator [Gynurincola endophyticus]
MAQHYILIAEDDEDDRFLLQTAFEENGFTDELVFVKDGLELTNYLEKIKIEPAETVPVFILLDLNMPKKDGREVLKEMKQDIDLKKIPVIVFTTTKNEFEIKRCYELGANTYVVKPVSFDSLVRVIREIRMYWINTATSLDIDN